MGSKTRDIAITFISCSAVRTCLGHIRECPPPPGPSWQTVYGEGKRGMKARENAIGRGKHEKGAQKRATCFALLQNKLKNDVARFTT